MLFVLQLILFLQRCEYLEVLEVPNVNISTLMRIESDVLSIARYQAKYYSIFEYSILNH